eukprot:1989353-Pyramimonas_sp.AAC.1
MERRPSSRYLRGNLLNPMQTYSPDPHLVLRTTQQGRNVRIVRRKWRHLPTSIQPRSVFRGKPRQTRLR